MLELLNVLFWGVMQNFRSNLRPLNNGLEKIVFLTIVQNDLSFSKLFEIWNNILWNITAESDITMDDGSGKIFVSNLPYEMELEEIRDIFHENVGEEPQVQLFSDENGDPRGCATIQFSSKLMAKSAVEKMNRYQVKCQIHTYTKVSFFWDQSQDRSSSNLLITLFIVA